MENLESLRAAERTPTRAGTSRNRSPSTPTSRLRGSAALVNDSCCNVFRCCTKEAFRRKRKWVTRSCRASLGWIRRPAPARAARAARACRSERCRLGRPALLQGEKLAKRLNRSLFCLKWKPWVTRKIRPSHSFSSAQAKLGDATNHDGTSAPRGDSSIWWLPPLALHVEN